MTRFSPIHFCPVRNKGQKQNHMHPNGCGVGPDTMSKIHHELQGWAHRKFWSRIPPRISLVANGTQASVPPPTGRASKHMKLR